MGDINYIEMIGQGIGIVAFSISCRKYFLKKKKDIIRLSMISYAFYIVHYFLIGALAGSYTLIISMTRDYYMYLREKHHKKHRSRKLYNNAFVFISLFAVYASLIIFNFSTEPKNTLPLIAGLVYMCCEWFTTNKTTLKISSGITNFPWIAYDILNLSIAGLLADATSLIACVLGVLKDKKLRRNVVKNNHKNLR